MAISHFRSSSSSASAFSSTVSGSRYRKREEGIGASGIYINTYIRPPRSFLSLLITSTRLPPRRKKGWQGGMGVCLFFPLCFFEKGKGSILGYIPIAFYTFGFYYLFFFLLFPLSLFVSSRDPYFDFSCFYLVYPHRYQPVWTKRRQNACFFFSIENDILHLRQSFSRVSWEPATFARLLCF